jgi:WD40 repeat protein
VELVFSRDGSRLATTGEDGTARLWDPATGAQLATRGGPRQQQSDPGELRGELFALSGVRTAEPSEPAGATSALTRGSVG